MPSTSSANQLSDVETCQRKGYWSRSWQSQKMSQKDILQAAIRVGLTTSREDYGEAAGEEVMTLGEERGLETNTLRIYDAVVSLAAVADLVTVAIRKPTDEPWGVPEPIPMRWSPSCFLVGETLRRIILVSHWDEERNASEIRSWRTVGEMSTYGLPMQQVIIVLGPTRDGLIRGPWTRGFQHPANKQLRFRKKSRIVTETFKASWQEISRVDHAEISNTTWLEAMLRDDVLPEVCFMVDVPVPENAVEIRETASRKLQQLHQMKELPDKNLSTCDWPVPCIFRRCCHAEKENEPSERNGFIRINTE